MNPVVYLHMIKLRRLIHCCLVRTMTLHSSPAFGPTTLIMVEMIKKQMKYFQTNEKHRNVFIKCKNSS